MDTKGHCFPKTIIMQAVYFKLRFSLSYRDVEEILKIRGVEVDHDTIQRWVNKFMPVYIPVENHTKFQLKTIPLIDAYLHSFFTNGRRIKDDKNEYETEDYSSPLPGWFFRA